MRFLSRRKILFPLLALSSLTLLCGSAWGAQLKLAWDPNAEPDLAGYNLYYGTASGSYGSPINVGNVTTYTLTGLTGGGAYFVAVTAYDTSANESGYSNEVSGTAYDYSETVSTPSLLSGPTTGTTGTSYTYTTGGSSSNLGHPVEYQFDWKGDGTDLSAWGSTTQSKTWTAAGTYNVRSRARCATHTNVVSIWSPSLTVTISPAPQSFTVTTNPSGRQITVDSIHYTAPQTFSWTPGSSHTLSVASPQSGSTGTRYIYSSWSDGGAQTHTVTASSATTYTAQFTTQYSLNTSVSPSAGGTVSPSGTSWYNSGQPVSISATGNAGYTFSSWSGDLSGSTNPASITMNGPKNVVANFATTAETISTPTVPSGPTTGNTNTSYDYSTGGSSSNLGHPVEYQFDWKGDGTDLSAWGSATQSKTWTAAGTYNVRARARCATHTSVVSSWSGSTSVSISSSLISHTITTNPSELQITVDDGSYTAPQTFSWTPGSPHTVSVSSPQLRNKGTRYIYMSWSDGGEQTHTINAPSSNGSYTAYFKKQNKLTTSVSLSEAGTVNVNGSDASSGSSNWFDDGQTVSIGATANSGYTFTGWSGDLSGITNPISLNINDPKAVIANFAPIPGAATLVSPSGTVHTTTPTYVWNAVPNSPLYYLSVDDATGNKILQWYSATAVLCGSGTGTCSITPATPLTPGVAQWKVQTWNSDTGGPGLWSLPMSFTVNTIFADVPSDYWAEEYVLAIYSAGMTTGCAQDDPNTPENERSYCPEDYVSREQMAALLVRAVEGEPAVNSCDSGTPFLDVTPDMWSCGYIKRLYELGITTGYQDGTYRPYDLVPREQMAAFLVRAAEGEPPENYCASGVPFPDVGFDMWSCDYIKRLKELNITTGYQDGTYGPYDPVTRAQMAAFLARAFLGMQ